jgi:pSer/pThr/pTyr-binding forkhead associated (FHA) protein
VYPRQWEILMAAQPPAGQRPAGYQPTRLETDDDIHAALQAKRAALAARLAGSAAANPAPREAAAVPAPPETPAFRPTQRPALALLIILDDGRDDGETIRIRADRFVIGRTDGDLCIAHDALISSRHAELSRALGDGEPLWLLTDLDSTNGTFVRIGSAVLKSGHEFILGRSRYRFDAGGTDDAPPSNPGVPAGATRTWQAERQLVAVPSLIEQSPTGDGARLPLTKSEYWIGRDARACTIVPRGDPYVCPRHARLYRDEKNRWHLANHHSVNGVWLRVEKMQLDRGCQFLLGEQRFLLRIP